MSFYTSLSGLKGAQTDMSVISNNIANASSTGFKRSRAQFGDLFASSPTQSTRMVAGQGQRLNGIIQQFTQGTLEASEKTLDLAIAGEGMFVVKGEPPREQVTYTRNGAFTPTDDGHIVDTTGQKAGLSLVAGGKKYALGTVDRTSTAPRDVYVAVSDASGLAASTTFDGRSVTAHDGDAAVGQESRQVPVACGGWSGGRDVTCTLSAYSTDWVGRWAPQGKHFVVVDAEVELGKQAVHEGSSTTYYEPAAGALRVALQGRGTPTSLPKDPQDPCHFRGRTTLQTALDHPRLSLALTCSMERSGSDGPAHGAAGLHVATRVSVPLP